MTSTNTSPIGALVIGFPGRDASRGEPQERCGCCGHELPHPAGKDCT